MEGEGAIQPGFGTGSWADIRRDDFDPTYYRIALGKGQGAYAGVEPEFGLIAVDDNWNGFTQGSTSNSIRIIHMQVESRIGVGSPLVTAGATSRVVRAPDDLRATGNWFKGRNTWSFGLLFARIENKPEIQRILHVRDAVPMKDDYGFYLNEGVTEAPTTTGATYNGIMPGFPTPLNTTHTAIISVDPARFAFFQDGVKTGEQLLLGKAPPNFVDAMRLGARLDGGNLQACAIFLRLARYWTGSMSDNEGIHYSNALTASPPPAPVVPPVVSVPATLRIREGTILTVPITKAGTGPCSVTYTTVAGNAKYGIDYNGVGPVVMEFGADETVKTFTVQTISDTAVDPWETFTVKLSNFVGCSPGITECTVTITEYPAVWVPLSASVKEGGILTLDITKTGEGPCSVAWETKQSKAGMVGVDYVGVGSPPVVVNFGELETSKAISVTTLQDAVSDVNEQFSIVLSGETNCTVGNRTCTITITDDEVATSGIYARSVTFASPAAGGGAGGGIGKPVYRVTSLADTNTAGTLRYGIGLGGRHIIFEVGGVIKLSGDFSFTKEDVYVSGETAPYPGITLRGTPDKGGNIKPQASKRITFSHINFERGHDERDVNTNADVVELAPGSLLYAEDIEFRHCSFWWGMDETVSVWATGEDAKRGTCQRISFTDCLFAEPLYKPELAGYKAHSNAGVAHNYGLIFGSRSYSCDIQYSVFTDCDMRTPFIDGDTSIVLANNVQLNCNTGSHVSVNNYDQPTKKYVVTCVGQVAISGPDTTSNTYSAMRIHSNVVKTHPAGSMVWADGLYSIKGPDSKITPGTSVTVAQDPPQKDYIADITKVARPIDIPNAPVSKLSAEEIRQRAIDNVGPFPKNRIPHLTRKIQHLKDNGSSRINHQSQVGGFTDFGTAKYERKLDGTTKFPDGTTIPAYPTLGTKVEDNWKNVRAWLELFLKQIQYD